METLKFKSRLLKTLQNVNNNIPSENDEFTNENHINYHRQSDRRLKKHDRPVEEKIVTSSKTESNKSFVQENFWSPVIRDEGTENESLTTIHSREVPVRDPGLETIPLQSKINAMYSSSYTDSETKRSLTDKTAVNENQNYYPHKESGRDFDISPQYDGQQYNNSSGPSKSENARLIGHYLCNMWQAQKMCDVMIRVDGQVFPIHKVALAAHSDSFASRHCNKTMAEISHIDLPRGLSDALKEVLRYIYTSEINISTRNVSDILSCAKYLGISKVVKKCESILLSFSTDNVLDFVQIAKKHDLIHVIPQMQSFICKRFNEITKTERFLKLPVEDVCKILSDDSLAVARELDVFTAAKRWIEYNKQTRLKFADEVLKTVRMIYIPPEELVTLVEPDMIPTLECQQMLMNVFRYQALKLSGSYLIDNDYYPPPRRSYRQTDHVAALSKGGNPDRLSSHGRSRDRFVQRSREYGESTNQSHYTHDAKMMRGMDVNAACSLPETPSNYQIQVPVVRRPRVVLCIGGINPFKVDSNLPCQLIEEYNPSTNCWRVLTKLPEARHHHASAVLSDLIYVIGGSMLDAEALENLANPTNVCYTYNYYQHVWTRIAPMNSKRMYHGVAILGGVLYAMGGENERGETLDTMEFYNPQTNIWGRAARMSDCKIGVAAIGHNGLVYVIGGYMETPEEKVLFGTVECYNPRRNRWTLKNPLPQPVCHSGVVEVDNILYLIGGSMFMDNSDVMPSSSSVYRYDEVSDRWDVITTLRIPRHDAGITCAGEKIYIVGGLTCPQTTALSDVEVYDVSNNKWLSGIAPLAKPLLGITCCSMVELCTDQT